ncbi:hypothetical protein LCGC14_0888950, partial [marine sediment metagenome]
SSCQAVAGLARMSEKPQEDAGSKPSRSVWLATLSS